MNIIKIALLSGLVLCAYLPIHAQSIGPASIDVAGGSASVGATMHEYAIGQVMASSTYFSSSAIVTPGVLQPAITATGISSHPIAAADLQVYPSPVKTVLFMQLAFRGTGVLQYGLYDVAGKLVTSREIVLQNGSERQALEVTAFAAGQYFLNINWIQAGTTYNASYKIQKL